MRSQTVLLLFLLIVVCIQRSAGQKDSTKVKLTPVGHFDILAGKRDDGNYFVYQTKMGLEFELANALVFGLSVNIAANVDRDTMLPLMYWAVGVDHEMLHLGERFTLLGRLRGNVGYWNVHPKPMGQIVCGIDARYRVSKFRYFGGDTIGVHVIASAGWGRDFQNDLSKGFFNVGIGFSDWLIVTFDVSTLFTPGSVLINYARIR